MGGCTFVLQGETPAEVKRKLKDKLREARHEGLCLDRRSRVRRDPKDEKFFAVLRVHT